MTKAIVSKILKDPVQYLKANGSKNYAEMVKEIFRLDEEDEG
jgi:glutamyl-tRNA reductase